MDMLEKMYEEMQEMKQEIKETNKEIKETKKSVISIEKKIDDMKVLYDGYNQNYNNAYKQKLRMKLMEEQIYNSQLRIRNLENRKRRK